MTQIKTSSRVSSILNDLKMRKEKLLPCQKISNQTNAKNFMSEKSNINLLDQKTQSSFNKTFHSQNLRFKSAIFHIDQPFFSNPDEEKLIEKFFNSFIKNKSLLQITQIKSLSLNQMHSSILETKLLKLNLKFALSTKYQKSLKTQQNSQNILNVFILSTINSSQVLNYRINWNENSWILILKNGTTLQKNQRQNCQNFYQKLSQSFFSYQQLIKKQTNKFPPILILQDLNCIFREGIFQQTNCQVNFQKLCQLHYNLFKAEKQLKISSSIEYLQTKIFQSYIEKVYIKKSTIQLAKFINYYKRIQQNTYKKYFNLWSIITAQASIQKMQNQIVDNKYCQQNHKKSIKQKVFNSWKMLYLKNKVNRY